MTREEILNIGLDEREIEAFGGKVKIRNLTIKEVKEVSKSSNDFENMVKVVHYALIDPKLSIEDIESLGSEHTKDLASIVEAVV